MDGKLWSKFRRASEDLRALPEVPNNPEWKNGAKFMAVLIDKVPKFYLPCVDNIVPGSNHPPEAGEKLKLPYPVVCILSDVDAYDMDEFRKRKTTVTSTHAITIAIQRDDDNYVQLFSILYSPREQRWIFLPISIGIVAEDNLIKAYELHTPGHDEFMREAGKLGVSKAFLAKEFEHDANCVVGLWRMLQIHDTKTVKVPVPSVYKKNAKKWGNGKDYDYHVLSVGGEVWDSPHSNAGCGGGVRSHLRRGHVRRLADRITWVRSTYVHGSREGFVAKDYSVTPMV